MNIFSPPPDLQNFISHFWAFPCSSDSFTYYATASSLTDMAFAFHSRSGRPLFSSVQGQTSGAGQHSGGNFFELFGVSLFSHAIPYIFGIPAAELNDRFISLEILLGKDESILSEKLSATTDVQQRIEILCAFFRKRLAKNLREDKMMVRAIMALRANKGDLYISGLSADSCLSIKQFERRFKEYAGFNPKLYARIVRFESVLNNRRRFTNLTETAHASGYYDQAHFIHEFKKFSGFSPSKFFSVSGY